MLAASISSVRVNPYQDCGVGVIVRFPSHCQVCLGYSLRIPNGKSPFSHPPKV